MLEFLKLEQKIFGLDISDLSLKIIKLKKRKNAMSVVSFNTVPIPAGIIDLGVIQNEDALVKIIVAACKNVKGQKLGTKYVVASLPEERSFFQVVQMPKMKEEELASAVLFEAENYIPLPLNEMYLDFETVNVAGQNHPHSDVLMVATPKKIVNAYVSCLKKAGLVPLALEVESEAITRALIKKLPPVSTVALVDFGKTSTDFIIFSRGAIRFTSSSPICSEQLTEAIAKSLGVDLAKAEKLKKEHGLSHASSAPAKKTNEAMEGVLQNLVVQIKKYMSFYQDHAFDEKASGHEKIEKILLCGGGAHLDGLPEFLSLALQIPVQCADISPYLSSRATGIQVHQSPLSFVTALGLALRNMK